MALNASKAKGGDKPQEDRVEQPKMEAGTYPVRLVQVLDYGLQPQRPYKNEPKAPAQEVGLTYEFVDSFMLDKDGKELEDKPRWFSEIIPLHNLKADRAKSTQRIKAMDPENVHNGDLTQMLGTPVMATITVTVKGDKTYVNISGLTTMRARDAAKIPELKNPTKMFDLDDPDKEVFESLPNWIQEKIQGNLKYNGSKLQALLEGKEAPAKAPEPEVEQGELDLDEENDTPW